MTILVVHSDGSIVASLRSCMEAAGMRVVEAGEVQDHDGLAESEFRMLVLLRLGPMPGDSHCDGDRAKAESEIKADVLGMAVDKILPEVMDGTPLAEPSGVEEDLHKRVGEVDAVHQATIQKAIRWSVTHGCLTQELADLLLSAMQLVSATG